jgi:hypothetical protein
MLKTNIAALEINEDIFSSEVLLPPREAVTRTALRGRLLNAVIRQVSVGF